MIINIEYVQATRHRAHLQNRTLLINTNFILPLQKYLKNFTREIQSDIIIMDCTRYLFQARDVDGVTTFLRRFIKKKLYV